MDKGDQERSTKAKQDALAPWDQRRGLGFTDYNNHLILIRATVEETAAELGRRAIRWEKDALDKEVLGGAASVLVFRLRGHTWTEILGNGVDACDLSREAKASVIFYARSDTCGSIGYDYYEEGLLQERFYATENGRGRPVAAESHFESRIRSQTLRDIKDIYQFTHQFFVDQDAFEPGLDYDYFFRAEEEQAKPSVALFAVATSFGPGLPQSILPAPDPVQRLPLVAPDAPRKPPLPIWTGNSTTASRLPRVTNPGIIHNIYGEEVRIIPSFERVDFLVLKEAQGMQGGIWLGK